jgi:hypothetical protein
MFGRAELAPRAARGCRGHLLLLLHAHRRLQGGLQARLVEPASARAAADCWRGRR